MTNPSPCLRIRTSFTSVGKRISCGSRTAWLAPFRNIDARRATPLDMDLAADLDAADLTFPVRTRFIDCPLNSVRCAASICLAYGNIKSQHLPGRGRFPMHCNQPELELAASLPANLAGFQLISRRFAFWGHPTPIFLGYPKNAPNPGGWPRSALDVIGRENRVLQPISARFFGISGRQWT